MKTIGQNCTLTTIIIILSYYWTIFLRYCFAESRQTSMEINVWSSESKAESNSNFAESRQTSMKINMGPECKTW